MKRFFITLISLYQVLFSPLLSLLSGGGACRYKTTCSEYAKQSLRKNGIIAGTRDAVRRFLSCRPGAKPYGITL